MNVDLLFSIAFWSQHSLCFSMWQAFAWEWRVKRHSCWQGVRHPVGCVQSMGPSLPKEVTLANQLWMSLWDPLQPVSPWGPGHIAPPLTLAFGWTILLVFFNWGVIFTYLYGVDFDNSTHVYYTMMKVGDNKLFYLLKSSSFLHTGNVDSPTCFAIYHRVL